MVGPDRRPAAFACENPARVPRDHAGLDEPTSRARVQEAAELSDAAPRGDQVKLVDHLRYDRSVEVTVQEAKTQLSRLLRRVEAGEEVVIRRGRERVAMLVRVEDHGTKREIWGDLEGSMATDFDEVPSDFEPYT